jgi:hypothetical protein
MLFGIRYRRIDSSKLVTVRSTFVVASIILFALLTTKQVGAGSWFVNGYVQCLSGQPKAQGIGSLGWSGQSSSASGATSEWLWHRSSSSSSWVQVSSGGDLKSGSSNYTTAISQGYQTSGEWYSTSGSIASFFSGQRNTQSGAVTCP